MKETVPEEDTLIPGIYKKSIAITQHRSVGVELVALHFWSELGMDEIFRACGLEPKQIELAKVAILGRLLSPGSERHTIHWYNKQSSLKEFSPILRDHVQKDAPYCIANKILSVKDEIDSQLRDNLKRLHHLRDTIFLYDLTNTYFEGSKVSSELCKSVKSKEKRDDCPLVTLALVVDQEGFPVFSRIYRGNQSEPETLSEILGHLAEIKHDLVDRLMKPHLCMDRGIATAENIAYL